MEAISLKEFLEISDEAVSKIVSSQGQQTCIFPFNGTRRWFLFEHADSNVEMSMDSYNDLTGKRYIEMFKMLFDHGIDAVVAPIFGSDILDRGDEYMDGIGAAMSRLADHMDFKTFYEEYDVRVHFYGEYRKKFTGRYAYLADRFDQITQQTSHNKKKSLFYGVFGSDASESVAEFSIDFYQKNSRPPNRREIVESYYGEYLERATIFIGFEKFSVFDYPLLGLGSESVYHTVAPSLYMTKRQLREILFDHIFLRPMDEPEYMSMPRENFAAMKKLYDENREVTFGVGMIRDGIWYEKHTGRRG